MPLRTRVARVCFIAAAVAVTSCASVANAAPDDTTADAVLGQADFASGQANRGGNVAANTLNEIRGVFVDVTGRLWAADSLNHRVLSWPDAAAYTNGQNADLVLGQLDFTSNQDNQGGTDPTDKTLSNPRSIAADGMGRMYVADSGNKRILRYDPPFTNGEAAVQVFGQAGSFTTKNQALANAATADNLGNPDGIAVDSAGNLYCADRFLHRVVVYNTPADSNNTTADRVLGQPDLTSAGANQGGANPTAKTLSMPIGVGVDKDGNVYVADEGNNRVLRFAAGFADNASATNVYGQTDFASASAGTSATGLKGPVYVAVDPKTGNLFVADAGNSRVLEYKDPADDSEADRVYGQGGDFTTGTPSKGGVSADSLDDVGGVATDVNSHLYAGDRLNHRLLRYNYVGPTNNGNANDNTNDGGNGGGGLLPEDCGFCGLCGAGVTAMMPFVLSIWLGMRRRFRVRRH